MPPPQETFIVVGAGHAGGRAVEALRAEAFAGRIVLVGNESHLPYERPPLSKELMQNKPGYDFPFIRKRTFYEENRVELCLGVTATELDVAARLLHLADGRKLTWDKILLTTGAQVRSLDLPGAGATNIYTLRTLDDAQSISAAIFPGARLVIIGGGFIGLEVASSAIQRGALVTVLEASDRLMSRAVASDTATALMHLHRANGVDVRLGVTVTAFNGEGKVEAVVTTNGSVAADLVVIGIGIIPNVDLASAAGLRIDNGIIVDEYCRTTAPNVFAAGDVTNHFNPIYKRHIRLESWLNAQNQAIAAGRNMCSLNVPYASIPWLWSDQFDVNIQIAGMPWKWDEIITRGDMDALNSISFRISDGRIVGATCINRARDMAIARHLISRQTQVTPGDLADEDTPLRLFLG